MPDNHIYIVFGDESLLALEGDGLNRDSRESYASVLCYRTIRISGYVSKTVSDLFIILLLKAFSDIATSGFVSV